MLKSHYNRDFYNILSFFFILTGISEDVAKWLTETRTLIGVGVDTPSVDPGSEHRGLAHKTFAAKNIFMLENVNLQKTLPSNQLYNLSILIVR